MVIAAHPDDADFGPAATAARWIDAGSQGWLVCCTSGDQGGEDPDATRWSWPHCARGAAGCRRDRRLCRRHVPSPARRGARQRPSPARAARPRDPDLPARRCPRHRPRVALLRRRWHQPHRPSGGRDGRGRRRLPGGPEPDGLPVAGSERPCGPPGPAALPLLVGHADTWVDVSATLERKLDALRAHASQIKDPDGLGERIRA